VSEPLPLILPRIAGYDVVNFLPSTANSEAYDFVQRWPEWSQQGLFLYGPEASGKTHLAVVWQARSQAFWLDSEQIDNFPVHIPTAVVLDDVDKLLQKNEEAVLHVFNHVVAAGGHVLLTAFCPPAELNFRLLDLRSRLLALPAIKLHQPDDELLAMLLAKEFSNRQLRVSAEIIEYLLKRVERSFAAIAPLVSSLDAAALRERKNITLPFLRAYFSTNA
jgi:DnaA regulatory inactivator Hda